MHRGLIFRLQVGSIIVPFFCLKINIYWLTLAKIYTVRGKKNYETEWGFYINVNMSSILIFISLATSHWFPVPYYTDYIHVRLLTRSIRLFLLNSAHHSFNLRFYLAWDQAPSEDNYLDVPNGKVRVPQLLFFFSCVNSAVGSRTKSTLLIPIATSSETTNTE